MKVIFLHIPKTAGQSVHSALTESFGADAICPARVNEQLVKLSIQEINRYQVFSGHFDWSLLDCIKGPKYVFTVLRNPLERILSFYFYLREQAAALPPAKLRLPQHQGMRAALELSPEDYFTGGPAHLRKFLDDHYDNFYTYYFAGRTFHGRSQLHGLINRRELSEDDVLRMAKDNLCLVDDVYGLHQLDKLFGTIRSLGRGEQGDENKRYEVNVNKKVKSEDRMGELLAMSKDKDITSHIERYCRLDNKIWEMYS